MTKYKVGKLYRQRIVAGDKNKVENGEIHIDDLKGGGSSEEEGVEYLDVSNTYEGALNDTFRMFIRHLAYGSDEVVISGALGIQGVEYYCGPVGYSGYLELDNSQHKTVYMKIKPNRRVQYYQEETMSVKDVALEYLFYLINEGHLFEGGTTPEEVWESIPRLTKEQYESLVQV